MTVHGAEQRAGDFELDAAAQAAAADGAHARAPCMPLCRRVLPPASRGDLAWRALRNLRYPAGTKNSGEDLMTFFRAVKTALMMTALTVGGYVGAAAAQDFSGKPVRMI